MSCDSSTLAVPRAADPAAFSQELQSIRDEFEGDKSKALGAGDVPSISIERPAAWICMAVGMAWFNIVPLEPEQ